MCFRCIKEKLKTKRTTKKDSGISEKNPTSLIQREGLPSNTFLNTKTMLGNLKTQLFFNTF